MFRIAWLSPINQSPSSKSSFFTHQVLPYLPAECEVELFVSDEDLRTLPSPSNLSSASSSRTLYGRTVSHFLRLHERDEADPFDAFVFHLENHRAADFSRFSVGCLPGIAYVHDLHFRSLPWGETPKAVPGDASATIRGEADRHIRELFAPSVQATDEDESDVAGVSKDHFAGTEFRGVLVGLGQRAVEDLSGVSPNLSIEMSQFPCTLCPEDEVKTRRDKLREQLTLTSNTPLVLFSGAYPIEERVQLALEAFSELPQETHLLWITNDSETEANARSLFSRIAQTLSLNESSVHFLRTETVETLKNAVCGADCVALPRFTALRGLPLLLPLAFSAGIPVVTSRFGTTVDIPESVALKIDVGKSERAELTRALRTILTDSSVSSALSHASRQYCEVLLDPKTVAFDLLEILRTRKAELKQRLTGSRQLLLDERRSLLRDLESQLEVSGCSLGAASLTESLELPQRILDGAVRDFGW